MLSYFQKQKKIFPKYVSGRYRKLKWIVLSITLGFYHLAPFMRWDRGPHAPDQAILIDMPARRAYFFGIEIWPQEVYILTGILILAAIALFFVTSLFGRVWCGYFCPHTVWVDLFHWVEHLLQGDRNARIKLDKSPWTLAKISKILLTHLIWIIISFLMGLAFVLYFHDAPSFLKNLIAFDISPIPAGFILGLAASTYLLGGFAREQVCTYMCPYARFQSAMFDKDTLIIGYDEQRGEPRGKHKITENWEGFGHCIDCTACVQVCPMGIDIRNGLQMECIACGLCVDACNEIMERVGLPPGLIRYDTTNHMEAQSKGGKKRFRFLRPRTLYYICVLTLVGGLMLYALMARSPFEVHLLHDRNPLYVQLSNGEIRNGYTLKILNKTHERRAYRLTVEGLSPIDVTIRAAGEANPEKLYVEPDSVGTYHLLLASPVSPSSAKPITVRLTDQETGLSASYESVFITRRE